MTSQTASRYVLPQQWLRYDVTAIAGPLIEAKTAAGVLRQMPYLPQWIEQAHEEQLRLEAVGTTRIEGAAFNQQEQAQALDPAAEVASLNRSQRQLRCANETYRWLRDLPTDGPVTDQLVLDIHRRMVTGCDDDHCEPGALAEVGPTSHLGCRSAVERRAVMRLLLPLTLYAKPSGGSFEATIASFRLWLPTIISALCIPLMTAMAERPAHWRRTCCGRRASMTW